MSRLQLGGNSQLVVFGAEANYLICLVGWVTEWLKAPVLKDGDNCFSSLSPSSRSRFLSLKMKALATKGTEMLAPFRCQFRCRPWCGDLASALKRLR
jgi:hypothetical protein